MFPKSVNDLIESFRMLPGIGEKTAERLAFSLLEMEDENIDFFKESLGNLKKNIHRCPNCNNITEEILCDICSNKSREKSLCVTSDFKNVFLFERMGVFRGYYHVLDGLISPIDGINPEDIGLEKLMDRIKKEEFYEIIFAFKPSIEGETTSLYIKRVLSDTGIRVTQLASGLPMGADIEYIDSLTLERALSDRKEIG